MTFRARLLAVLLIVVLVPMTVFAVFVRSEMTDRLTAQYQRQVAALVEVLEVDLAQERDAIGVALEGLRSAVLDDNRFRRAAVDRALDERAYLLDYAWNAMRLTGLSMLQIQDDGGRILSSGHFRNEYDRLEPDLPALLASTPDGTAFLKARAPDEPFLALARVDSFQMSGRRFTLIAGTAVERPFLARLTREGELTVSLHYPGGTLMSEGDTPGEGGETRPPASRPASEYVRELSVPFVDADRGEVTAATIRVAHSLAELHALRRNIDRWFVIAVATTIAFSFLLASWLSGRVSRPLIDLAEKTSRVDLDRLDVDFGSRRKDEIGALSRLLGAMTQRLRASAVRIKEAERRATLGEVARQVNHDIKNGLAPIRNVFRHLTQLAREDPHHLPDVFRDRQSTIDSSIEYLENLSSNYARLSPRSERRPCDVNAIIQQVISNAHVSAQTDLRTDPSPEPATVLGDPIALRRILENLVDNALDSLESERGTVLIATTQLPDGERPRVAITVADTGGGLGEEQLDRIFQDFYTTKEEGTGLGLSIVRRLVMDLHGSVRVESEVGKGSRFIVELPAGGT